MIVNLPVSFQKKNDCIYLIYRDQYDAEDAYSRLSDHSAVLCCFDGYYNAIELRNHLNAMVP